MKQPIVGQDFITNYWSHVRLPRKMNDHPVRFSITCDQHVYSPSHCMISIPELPLHVISYPISHDAGSDPIHRPAIPHRGSNQHRIHQYEIKIPCSNPGLRQSLIIEIIFFGLEFQSFIDILCSMKPQIINNLSAELVTCVKTLYCFLNCGSYVPFLYSSYFCFVRILVGQRVSCCLYGVHKY